MSEKNENKLINFTISSGNYHTYQSLRAEFPHDAILNDKGHYNESKPLA